MHNASHVRQIKENRNGKRFPMSRDLQATIRAEKGLFYGIINENETVAISDDIDVVAARLKRADRNIEYSVYDADRRRNYETVENYHMSLLPDIYRITSSNTKDYGLIIALNSIKGNEHSDIRLFYDMDDVIEYFKRKKSDNYYVYLANKRDIDKDELGGIEAFDVPREWCNVADLRAAIEARQKAGSHKEYVRKVKQEQTQIKYGYIDPGAEREWDDV